MLFSNVLCSEPEVLEISVTDFIIAIIIISSIIIIII